jgi:hypothetical protein
VAFHSGHGGCVTFKKTSGAPPGVTVNVASWNYEERSRLGETTHCGSGGYATWIPGPKEASGQFVLPWDDAVLVNTTGYTAGATGDATFKLGDSSLTIKGPIIIESTNFEDDNVSGDPVRVTCNYRGNGVFTLEVPPIVALEAGPAPTEEA